MDWEEEKEDVRVMGQEDEACWEIALWFPGAGDGWLRAVRTPSCPDGSH